MSGAIAIARRELGAYFRQSAGWIIIGMYLLLCGIVFSTSILVPGRIASLRDFFSLSGWLLLPVAPAISMRLLAEELRSGTIENLLTSPISTYALVFGKYLGALAFLAAVLVPTVVYPIILSMYAEPKPDLWPILVGYLCLFLLGGLYLAVGILASSLTSNSTLAFMVTLFSILGLIFASTAMDVAPEAVRRILGEVAIGPRIIDFSRGIIDSAHVAFFVGGSLYLVFLTIVVMEVRRWR